jgi:hypothetical protein
MGSRLRTAQPDEFQSRWWYDSAAPTNNHEHGLDMVNISEGMRRVCGIAHGSFCAKHDLQEWALKITQMQPGVFKIVSTAPIGGTVQNITLRPGLNFGDHLVHTRKPLQRLSALLAESGQLVATLPLPCSE